MGDVLSQERGSHSRVVISNHWHKPGIKVSIFYDGVQAPKGAISLEIGMKDFVAAVLEEMKPKLFWSATPVMFFSKKKLEKAMASAVEAALEKVKQASVEVVS